MRFRKHGIPETFKPRLLSSSQSRISSNSIQCVPPAPTQRNPPFACQADAKSIAHVLVLWPLSALESAVQLSSCRGEEDLTGVDERNTNRPHVASSAVVRTTSLSANTVPPAQMVTLRSAPEHRLQPFVGNRRRGGSVRDALRSGIRNAVLNLAGYTTNTGGP